MQTGMQYRAAHPGQDFVVYYFPSDANAEPLPVQIFPDTPAIIPKAKDNQRKRPHGDDDPGEGTSKGPKSSRRTRRSAELVEVVSVGNIHQLLMEFQTAGTSTKIIKISQRGDEFCDTENYAYQNQKNIFENTYSLFYLLGKSFWSDNAKHTQLALMNVSKELYLIKLAETTKSNYDKKASMNKIINAIESQIGGDAQWYYWPKFSYTNVTQTIEIESKFLSI